MDKHMDVEENLTNEGIMKRRESTFDLVNYAIKVAENMIQSGREPMVRTHSQNVPMYVLAEIANHKEVFADIVERRPYNEEPRHHRRESAEIIIEEKFVVPPAKKVSSLLAE